MRASAQRGVALVMVMAFLILFATMATFFVFTASVFVKNSGWEQVDHQVFWIAEAGLQKAIWNLKTPVASGGRGELWTTAGTLENLANGNYTMVVEAWDYALAANGATAVSVPPTVVNPASNAIDGNGATFWESSGSPVITQQDLIITLPYAITVNRLRFLAFSTPAFPQNYIPRDYSWAVSPDNAVWTPALPAITNNTSADSDLAVPPALAVGGPADVFPAQTNVRFVRLRTTRDGVGAPARARVIALEINGRRITSTGRITTGGVTIARTVRQTVVTDDALPQNQVAYYQPDWTEQ